MGDLDTILALERQVWDALVAGDAGADAALLGDDFVGLYNTGFGDKAEHVAQLAGGPTVARYALSQARLIDLGPGCVLLAYRALYLRRGATEEEAMYVASIWREGPEGWRNIFSQDTAEGGSARSDPEPPSRFFLAQILPPEARRPPATRTPLTDLAPPAILPPCPSPPA